MEIIRAYDSPDPSCLIWKLYLPGFMMSDSLSWFLYFMCKRI